MDLIKGITSDHDLIELADLLDISITNIYTLDEIKKPLPKNGNYIILLENGDGIGHWVCQFNDMYFDSAGEPAPLILGIKNTTISSIKVLLENIVVFGVYYSYILNKIIVLIYLMDIMT